MRHVPRRTARPISRSISFLALVLTALAAGCASHGGGGRGFGPDEGTLLTEADLENPNVPIESILERKVPGLQVRRTADGGIALQLRGTSAYTGADTPPLYMLNDGPYQPGPDGALTGINPADIASIKVLKGAQASLYGIQGANGVILIWTKKPKIVKH